MLVYFNFHFHFCGEWSFASNYFKRFHLSNHVFRFRVFYIGLFPLAFRIAFSGLELAIAFIQSIVFVILTSSYLKDGLELHSSDARKSTILNIKASINRFVIINKRNISTLSNPQNTIVRRFSSTGSYNNSSGSFIFLKCGYR